MRVTKDLIGKEVIKHDASFVGKIVDVDIDFKENIINSFALIVSKGGIQKSLKINKGELVIPGDFVDVVGDKIILSNVFESDKEFSKESVDDLKDNLNDDLNDDLDDDLDLDKFEEEINDLKVRL